MSKPDMSALAKQMIDAVRAFVAKAEAGLTARLDALEAHVRALPVPEKGEPGDKGETGQNGKDGVDGKDGIPGKDGENGADGKPSKDGRDGVDGKDGVPGKDGERGDKGDPGEKGIDGRDAFDIDILPEIDEAKVYRRGTYACHAGGLWRAVGTTKGMRGWECIVVGIARLSVRQEDVRCFVVERQLSNSEIEEMKIVLPVVLDQGVYRPESKYRKGDGVTFGGSWWIAQVDEPTDKPGISDQWRLAVKRGRDGKDK